jgi:Fe-Mn family superoxide dismutase
LIKQFGAGWAWLVVDQDKNLKIYSLPNQDSPLLNKETPILGVDVWEHSYYLKYQNRRADFVEAWWNVLDWNKIEEKYQAALKN